MSKKRDTKVTKPPATDADPMARASREQEAKFPSHLSPIIQCKHSVLTFSRIEFYGGIGFGAVVWVLPVSGVTRSFILLFALAPLVDVVWRSPWSHAWLRVSKVRAIVLLVGTYLIISASMILHDYGSAALAIKAYATEHAEGLFRWAYLVIGVTGYYLSTKLISVLKSYAQDRKAEKLVERQRVLDTGRGWLDYRLESEKSSRRLHFLVARMSRAVKFMALLLSRYSWFIPAEGKKPPVVRTRAAAAFLTYVFNTYAAKTEPQLKEFEANAKLFIDSTEGHLKMATKQGDQQVAELYEYFQAQLKDIRDVVNAFSQSLRRLKAQKAPPAN